MRKKYNLLMKIIVVGPNYDNYSAASYQKEFMDALKGVCDFYYHYQESDSITIKKLLSSAKFVPDIIFYNHGWLSDNINLKDLKYSNLTGNWPKDIKHIIFLNKEYVLLKEKLKEIKQYKFDLIFSHLHNFDKFNNTKIRSVFLPLACSYKNISKERYKKIFERKYDLYFSGILQNWDQKETQGDLRKRIQHELFYVFYDFPILKKFKYRKLKIYWKPFYKNRFKNILSDFLHGKRLNQVEYFNTLSNSKCVLHTSSPIGILSTRVFEALGSGAIGLFSEESNANVILDDNLHFISFNKIEELIFKIFQIKKTTRFSTFQKIADNGRKYVEDKHTWKNRVLKFKYEVSKL